MVGEVFRLNVSFFLGGGAEECFRGESWDRSSNSSVHEFFVFGRVVYYLMCHGSGW